MKALVTRVSRAKVTANGKVTGQIAAGMAVFAGIEKTDINANFSTMAAKIANLRIFEDENGKFNYSLLDKNYPVLCISNFTLCADARKGRRPSFEGAMDKAAAERLFPDFVNALRSLGLKVETGSFGDHMDVEVDMHGPVNIILEA